MVGCWRGYLSGARCRLAYGPADSTATHCLRLVLPFWYQLKWVVTGKRAVKRVCVFITLFGIRKLCSILLNNLETTLQLLAPETS